MTEIRSRRHPIGSGYAVVFTFRTEDYTFRADFLPEVPSVPLPSAMVPAYTRARDKFARDVERKLNLRVAFGAILANGSLRVSRPGAA